MSNRRCNLCALNDMRRLAAQTGRIVTLRPKKVGPFFKGVDVYVHPASYEPPLTRDGAYDPTETPVEEGKNTPQWWACWLAEIPETCAC